MKLCKRFALGMLVAVLMISLCGCIIIPLSKYYDYSADEVESVQFYDLRAQDAVRDGSFDTIYDPVCTLSGETVAEFLKDFSKLEFSDEIVITIAAVDPSFSYGIWVVRINFTNGQYAYYSCAGYGMTLDADGKYVSSTHYSCDDAELEELIGKYYEIE